MATYRTFVENLMDFLVSYMSEKEKKKECGGPVSF
jgi:hypothetical protein